MMEPAEEEASDYWAGVTNPPEDSNGPVKETAMYMVKCMDTGEKLPIHEVEKQFNFDTLEAKVVFPNPDRT